LAAKITALEPQRNKERVSVFLDGRFAFGVPAIVGAALRPGQVLSEDEVEELRDKGDVEEAYNAALNFLTYRPRSRAEVVTYLRRRDVPESQIDAVTGRLQRAGLIGDEAFARYWVENRDRFRPRGPAALRYELRSKGINDDLIAEALESLDLSESAHHAASNKARQLSHMDRMTFQRKLVEFLARRGFAYSIAKEAADRLWNEVSQGATRPDET
jgi:regulatory protein